MIVNAMFVFCFFFGARVTKAHNRLRRAAREAVTPLVHPSKPSGNRAQPRLSRARWWLSQCDVTVQVRLSQCDVIAQIRLSQCDVIVQIRLSQCAVTLQFWRNQDGAVQVRLRCAQRSSFSGLTSELPLLAITC